VAQRFNELLVNFGGGACYRSACFLYLLLKEMHELKGEAVIGFVNDGTDDLYGSHAWFEIDGKRTDLAIRDPMYPERQPRGPLLIHGIEFRPGDPGLFGFGNCVYRGSTAALPCAPPPNRRRSRIVAS
jgi:hypothetical protein